MFNTQNLHTHQLQNYLDTVLAHIDESVWVVKHDYTFLAFNQRFLTHTKKNFGYDLSLGKHALDIGASEETKAFWKKRYDACLAGETLEEIDTYSHLGLILKTRMIPMHEEGKIVAALCFSVSIKASHDSAWHGGAHRAGD